MVPVPSKADAASSLPSGENLTVSVLFPAPVVSAVSVGPADVKPEAEWVKTRTVPACVATATTGGLVAVGDTALNHVSSGIGIECNGAVAVTECAYSVCASML